MAYLRRRLAHLSVVLLAVSLLTFVVTDILPGDPALALLGESATAGEVAALRDRLGLDDPLPARYGRWLGGVLRGDLGTSLRTGEPVAATLGQRFPVSLELMLLAQAIALLVAVPAGAYAAWRPGGRLDRMATPSAFALVSLPNFALGLLLIYVFSVRLRWLPATGYVPPTQDLGANLRGMFLPALALGLTEAPVYLRVLRSEMISTLRQTFIAVARAKGLPARRVLAVHALCPSSLTLVTLIGLNAGHLLAGAVIIETLFALPGIGRLLIEAIHARDLVLVQGVVLLIAVGYVLINALVDVAYGLIDPRLRHARPGT